MPHDPRLIAPDADDAAEVRAALVAAGWTVDGVLAQLGADGWAALARDETVPAARALRADPAAAAEPAGVLTRLFLLHEPVPLAAAGSSVPWRALRALGLVDLQGDDLVAALDLRPYGEADSDWYVVSDRDDARRTAVPSGPLRVDVPSGPLRVDVPSGPLRVDHVLGVGGASLTLAGLVPRLPRRLAVDVGTGCGVQALHLSRHCDHVVGTDTNARALALADLTWRLSGLEPERVEWREGSLLEPLGGVRADLLVSNPPFVVSPGHRFTYRDAGMRGDELGRALMEQVPGMLADDGWAVLLANWLHLRGRDWRDRVAAWAEPALASGADVWVAEREALDPSRYASTWLHDAGDLHGPAAAERYDEWLAAFDDDGVEAIGMGWVVLHRSGAASPSLRIDDVSAAPRRPDGSEVVARLADAAAVDRLDAVGTLGARFVVRPGVVLEELTGFGERGAFPLPARVSRASDAGGWREPAALDAAGLALLRACDGATTAAEAAASAAAAVGADEDDVTVLALHLLRDLTDRGVLAPRA